MKTPECMHACMFVRVLMKTPGSQVCSLVVEEEGEEVGGGGGRVEREGGYD